jgi:hypothetical protein
MKRIYSKVLIGEHFVSSGIILYRKVSGGAKIIYNCPLPEENGRFLDDSHFSADNIVFVVNPIKWLAENTPTTKLHYVLPGE